MQKYEVRVEVATGTEYRVLLVVHGAVIFEIVDALIPAVAAIANALADDIVERIG